MTRDDFSVRVKNALALRAGYVCSMTNCGRSTVGPSDESSEAVTNIGVAAHICAASSGPGARRYAPNMTPEQRAGIENGIWLCANCAVAIDRDDVTFSREHLQDIKRTHEMSRRIAPQPSGSADLGDVIRIGPDIVCVGKILGAGRAGYRVGLDHFVIGTSRDLLTFASDFSSLPTRDRYVLVNEFGDGRQLSADLEVSRSGASYEVLLPIEAKATRSRWDALGASMCRETGRLIAGMDALVQHLESLLGLAVGDSVFHPHSGSSISCYYRDYAGTAWFARLLKMEIIRLSSIPVNDRLTGNRATPLRCVNRVFSVDVPCVELTNQRLHVSLALDLEGFGRWEREIEVFIYNDEQLERASQRQIPEMLRGIVDAN